MSYYSKLLQHSILDLEEIEDLIESAQKECECVEGESVRCLRCLDREKIIMHYMQLVRKICRELSEKSFLHVDEFMADGIIGLNNAIDEFDLWHESKFFHFAQNAIRWQVIAGQISGPLIRIPSGARRKIQKIKNRIEEYEKEGKKISYEELCEEFDINKKKLIEFLTVLQSKQVKSFLFEEDGPDDVVDQKVTKYHYDSEEWIDQLDVKEAIETLDDHQKKIITHIYGIGVEEKTLGQLSKEFGQNYEKVRWDYHRALKRLKRYFERDLKKGD